MYDFASNCFSLVNSILNKIKKYNFFKLKKIMNILYFIYCLVRGVKNKDSLKYLKSFFVNELASQEKAQAFENLLLIMIKELV